MKVEILEQVKAQGNGPKLSAIVSRNLSGVKDGSGLCPVSKRWVSLISGVYGGLKNLAFTSAQIRQQAAVFSTSWADYGRFRTRTK